MTRDPRIEPSRGDELQRGPLTRWVLDVNTRYVCARETCTHGPSQPATHRDVRPTLIQFRNWAKGAKVLYTSIW
jgi:hypothetical protein